jgi:hypothetical protein
MKPSPSVILCHVCGRPILTRGYEVDNNWYHPACFICAYCGKRIKKQYVPYRKKYYHVSCLQEKTALHCAVCDGVIEGRYIKQAKKNYHPDCFRKSVARHCVGCGRPIMGKHIVSAEGSYHPRCHARHRGLRCSITGKLIHGRYYEDEWGNVYSSEVYLAHEKCVYCGRVMHRRISGNGVLYSDGRTVCGICRQKVLTPRREKQRVDEVLSLLRAEGIYVSLNRIPVEFVDRGVMKRFLRLQRQRRERSGVFQHPGNWQENGDCRLMRLEKNHDPDYGEGFRRVRRFVEERGLPALLERMMRFKTLPRGY